MKGKSFVYLGLATTIGVFGHLSVAAKDETLKPKICFYFQQEENMKKFVTSLSSMDAIIYIPEDKLKLAKEYGLERVTTGEAIEKNADFIKFSSSYVQIHPSTDVSSEYEKTVVVSFETLEMAVFVKKDNLKSAQEEFVHKDVHPSVVGDEFMKLNSEPSEVLKIKITRESNWQNYVPVK